MIDHDAGTHRSRGTRQVRQDMGQLTEPELRRSTTAPRILREANGGLRFGRHPGSLPAAARP
ncbi:MAG TPA: hypothetical protein VK932_13920, partial [Kofleriaceae bacterium]|nr:hypothetical protein [Kofleriaceae bacterium]